ncbi:MAG: chorismate synthase [Actinobacteria bacterium]|nr:chorismate synthase [Actinomycetota bacterium]
MHLRFTTAGESHGPGLVAVIEGVPAGLRLLPEDLDVDLARRQLGHGRGGRMKIETDTATVISGIRHGVTLGSPIALSIANRDYANWEERMNPWPVEAEIDAVHLPRPGHADLAGVQKFGHDDVRNVLERASARETTARVAVGAVARAFLRELGVEVRSHVTRIGAVDSPPRDRPLRLADFDGVDQSPVRCLDKDAERAMIREIDEQRKANESLGGIFEVLVFGAIPGLGSYTTWDGRIEGRLAQAICSIQAIKGVGFGDGFDLTGIPGSQAHDEMFPGGGEWGFHRTSNHAGGIEGGMTNGETVVIKGAMKPLPTLTKPLQSVDIATGEAVQALRERTDSCTVPAAGVVAEAMAALVFADAYLEKFGGDNVADTQASVAAYRARIAKPADTEA